MDMDTIDMRLRMAEVAEAAARDARAPGAAVTRRRGARRRAVRVSATALLAVALVGGAVQAGRLGGSRAGDPSGSGTRPVGAVAAAGPLGRAAKCSSSKLLVCGKSQGIAWDAVLIEKGPEQNVLGLHFHDVTLQILVRGHSAGKLDSPLPTSGNNTYGPAIETSRGRMRAWMGILSPSVIDKNLQPARMRLVFGNEQGDPSGYAETVVIPVPALHASVWVAFIPANAWEINAQPIDSHGNPVPGHSGVACSTPPRPPLRDCGPRPGHRRAASIQSTATP
jgi:hypothetical protein